MMQMIQKSSNNPDYLLAIIYNRLKLSLLVFDTFQVYIAIRADLSTRIKIEAETIN